MIQINLLPWREHERKMAQTRFGVIVGIAAGLGLICAVIFHMHLSGKIHKQTARNSFLQTALDQESSKLMSLDADKRQLNNIVDQLNFLYGLRDSGYRAVRLLNEMAASNPEGVSLSKIIRAGNAITVFGKAKSNLQITLFMESIEKSKHFTQPVLTEISGKEGGAGEDRSFQLKVEQTG